MSDLIKIVENNGSKAVSARELHKFLDASERFGNWIERQFQYGFVENVDYVGCKEFNPLANQELTDYAQKVMHCNLWVILLKSWLNLDGLN